MSFNQISIDRLDSKIEKLNLKLDKALELLLEIKSNNRDVYRNYDYNNNFNDEHY